MANQQKKIAILQSNYIPWKGYFDLINSVDEFVLYDSVQYTKRDWRNRNKIKTPKGFQWLSIPVNNKGKYFQAIQDTIISDQCWARKHWDTIRANYAKAKFFKEYNALFKELYLSCDSKHLSQINFKFLVVINNLLGIKAKIRWSSEFVLVDGKSERLLGICKDCNAKEYVSGPAAQGYLNESLFAQENIKVSWVDYSGYAKYTQLYGQFEHAVSIIDLIFNEGPNAQKYMKSFGEL